MLCLNTRTRSIRVCCSYSIAENEYQLENQVVLDCSSFDKAYFFLKSSILDIGKYYLPD